VTADAHVEAVKTLIGVTVRLYEDGQVPDEPEMPYAVLYADNGDASRTTLAAVSDRRDHAFHIKSVGLDPTGVRSVSERVRVAVLDQRPAVAGRATSPITQETSQPLRVDRDVTPHRLFTDDLYTFSSVPTS
jgi:hypothetical protein